MVVLSILVLLDCLDDLEGLLQLGIKGRVAQMQWPSRVRVPPVTPVAFTPACPGPVGTGPCGAFEFSSILSFYPSCLALQPTVCTVHTLSPSKQTAYKY